MATYQKRAGLYVLWYCLVTFIGIQIYLMGLDGNTQGGRCFSDTWHYGDWYQWVWDKQPCRFSVDFLVGYLFYFVLYLLFNYIRRRILKVRISISRRCFEVGGWFGINWVYLLWLTKTEYGVLDLVMVRASGVGLFFFFLPFLLVAFGVGFWERLGK